MQVEKELQFFSTFTPQFLLNLHTGLSLTENIIIDAVLIQFDLLMMSTEFLETCKSKSDPVTGPVCPRGWVEV